MFLQYYQTEIEMDDKTNLILSAIQNIHSIVDNKLRIKIHILPCFSVEFLFVSAYIPTTYLPTYLLFILYVFCSKQKILRWVTVGRGVFC